jgi:hypothetical protein
MKQNEYPQEILELLEFGRNKLPGQQEADVNETMPLDLVKIQVCKPCEDCDRKLLTPRVVHSKLLIRPYKHWSKQCQTCRKFQCTKTGKFVLTNTELRHQHMNAAGLRLSKKTTKKLQNDK